MLKVLALFKFFKQILWDWKIQFSIELWINLVCSFQCFFNLFCQCSFNVLLMIFQNFLILYLFRNSIFCSNLHIFFKSAKNIYEFFSKSLFRFLFTFLLTSQTSNIFFATFELSFVSFSFAFFSNLSVLNDQLLFFAL